MANKLNLQARKKAKKKLAAYKYEIEIVYLDEIDDESEEIESSEEDVISFFESEDKQDNERDTISLILSDKVPRNEKPDISHSHEDDIS